MQQRQMFMRFPFQWSECTGAVPVGRSVEETARKEIQEELFSDQKISFPLEKLGEFLEDSRRPFTWNTVFMGFYNGEFKPSWLEVRKLVFLPVEEVISDLEEERNGRKKRKYTTSFRKSFELFLRKIRR